MDFENIFTAIIIFLVALLFLGIGIYSFKIDKPMGFYSGIEIKEEEISDIKAYNKENGIMWCIYSSWYFISAILGLFLPNVALILLVSGVTIGLVILVVTYNKIKNKYKQ